MDESFRNEYEEQLGSIDIPPDNSITTREKNKAKMAEFTKSQFNKLSVIKNRRRLQLVREKLVAGDAIIVQCSVVTSTSKWCCISSK